MNIKDDHVFMADGGEMGARVRAFDWSSTALGAPEYWSPILKATVQIVLCCAQPMMIWWGPKFIQIYNDAYLPALEPDRHPMALGQRARDCWPEKLIIDDLDTERLLMDGGPISQQNELIPVMRNGKLADAYWTYSMNPIKDPSVPGGIGGMLMMSQDVTAANLAHKALLMAEQRQAFRLSLHSTLRDLSCPGEIMAAAVEQLGRHLKAGRCGYAEINVADSTIAVKCQWTDGLMVPLATDLRLQDFSPDMTEDYRNGRPFRLNDAQSDPRVLHISNVFYAAARIASEISVPLVKEGHLVESLFVHDTNIRHWTDEDETLVRDVAELTWSVIQRARAEIALRDLNETLERRVEERICIANLFEARFRSIFDLSEHLIGLIGLDGTVLEANKPFWVAAMTDPAISPGPAIWDAFRFPQQAAVSAKIKSSVETAINGAHIKCQIEIILPDTRVRSYDVSVSPVHDKSGRVTFIVIKALDVTDIRSTEDQLRQSQKMEAVGQLTGGIAHDFNNMLQVITIGLDMARRRIDGGRFTDALSFMGHAFKGVERAASLTQRLLAFARRQALDSKPEWANRLVLGMVDLIQRTVGPEIELKTTLCDEQWAVICDANQLENALLNLTINARDAMPNGGTLTLSTQPACLDDADIEGQAGLLPGDFMQVSVTDNGVGMSPDVLAHAFEPFFTTKPFGAGTGLGLSQIYGFVQQSGGLIRLESIQGAGTTVRIFLPRNMGPRMPVSEMLHTSSANTYNGKGETILLVEDIEGTRVLTAVALRELGYKVVEAGNGAEALVLLSQLSHLDLLIADLGLPLVNGIQVAEHARRQRPLLPVLFVSGADFIKEHGLVGTELLHKPYTFLVLAEHISRMMGPQKGPETNRVFISRQVY